MKVYSAVVRLVLRTNKTLANGLHPIMLRVSFGYTKEKSTGYSCDTAHWDKKNQLVKKGFEHAEIINRIITEYKNKVVERKLRLEMSGMRYTPDMLLDDSRTDFSARTHEYKAIMEDFLSDRQIRKSTKVYYDYAYRLLAEFMGNEHFLVNDLTENRMAAFIKQAKEHLSEGTIHTACAKIAAVCHHAMAKGMLQACDYCFQLKPYARMVRKANRKAYIDKDNLIRIEEYYLRLVTEDTEKGWQFRDGAEERIRKRSTAEFALCFWIAMLKLNGSAPIDVALLRSDNYSLRHIADEHGQITSYYCFDFKRSKTGTFVRPRIRCDRLAKAVFQPLLDSAGLRDGFLFPIVQNDSHTLKQNRTEEGIRCAVQHIACSTKKRMRTICEEINAEVEKVNRETGQCRPLINISQLSCYNMRHSFAMAYLSSPGANVNALATLLARSPNTIGTYITQLCNDQQLVQLVSGLGI